MGAAVRRGPRRNHGDLRADRVGRRPRTRPSQSRYRPLRDLQRSLNRNFAGQLIADLSTPANAQAATVAEIVQRIRPDVLLINEFDFDASGTALRLFQDNYLSVPHNGAAPIDYGYRFTAPSNTGIPSGFDLNNNGVVAGPDDAFGFGFFPGSSGWRSTRGFRSTTTTSGRSSSSAGRTCPARCFPTTRPRPPRDWYSPAEQAVFRLSSKSHWDVPIEIGNKTVHFLVSHPTPPVFDGPEDRNGTRNNDEIRFWADYISPGQRSRYIYDDNGVRGGLKPGSLFVIAGDQNSDPLDGDSIPGSIQQLLDHPLVNTKVTPASPGAVEQNTLQGGANLTHRSDPRFDTADFADTEPGNLRADYVLPRKNLQITDAGVFWPLMADPLFRLVGIFPFPSSDHRSVWVDLAVPSYHGG